MTVLLVTNARAAGARRRLSQLEAALPMSAQVCHRVTHNPADLDTLVGHGRWRPDDLLVINGGDGALQHGLSVLLARCPAERLPRIACLPGGTTNMSAFDLNDHRSYRNCLTTLRRILAHGTVEPAPRPVVRVEGSDGTPRCGLFFGMGTIVQGIEYFHQRVRPSGGGHELGAGVALLRALWGIARRQPPFADPLAVTVDAPDLLPAAGSAPNPLRLLLVSTLERLFLGIRPYWGQPGPLRATVVEARAPRLLRHMPRLLRGRPNGAMTPANGYHSGGVGSLSLGFQGSYTLDGELFRHAGDRMRVSATVPVRFLPL